MKKIIVIFVFIFCIACAQKTYEENSLIIPPVNLDVVE